MINTEEMIEKWNKQRYSIQWVENECKELKKIIFRLNDFNLLSDTQMCDDIEALNSAYNKFFNL